LGVRLWFGKISVQGVRIFGTITFSTESCYHAFHETISLRKDVLIETPIRERRPHNILDFGG